MRKILYHLLFTLTNVICWNARTQGQPQQTPPPNIIFIMDDQHRWDALGFINPQVITPTLDSLANNGLFFNQAVAQVPMSVASRNSLMFGLYPHQAGVLRNAGGGVPDSNLPGKTMAQYFKDAGYETAGFGKTHWGRYPTDTRGFEVRYDAEIREKGAVMMADTDPEAKAKYDAEIAIMGAGEENNIGYLGFTSKLKEEEHRDGWITKQAIEYIRNRTSDKPLFFYLSYYKPHAGHNVPEGYEDMYDLDNISYATQPDWEKDHSPHANGVNRRGGMYENFWKNASEEEWKTMTMRYYANITWIDDMIGRVLKELEQKKLLENAVIVYLSDHGEMLGERFYRFNKYTLYDTSIKVPIIVAGTALSDSIPLGTTVSRPAELVDILPTLLESAGIQKPESLPGENLLKQGERKATFATLHERNGEAAFMWRTETHKLILVLNRKENVNDYNTEDIIAGEFYNLEDDPDEWIDLYEDDNSKTVINKYKFELLDFLQQMK